MRIVAHHPHRLRHQNQTRNQIMNVRVKEQKIVRNVEIKE
jgi:hypothetical protein